ncbi:MAG TPA: HAMP domain-containing sensor histidine kinase, partial [Streptosporangiaceae bacterium]
MTAARAGRQRNWVTAFRRSTVGRAIIRRLPVPAKRWLRVGRRWQRSAVAQLGLRWHRSLQLRVVSTTLVLSGLVIAVLGFFLIQSVAAGLLSNAENSADALVRNGRTSAIGQSSVNVLAPSSPTNVATTTARALQQPSGTTGSYLVFIQLTNIDPAIVHWVGQSNVNITATIPQTLIAKVKDEQNSEKFVNKNTVPPAYEPTTLVYNSGVSVPALAVGVPLSGYYQLYYVFPFTQQQATLLLVQRVLVGVALAVIVLLAAIASLVTRWVVLPVRHAAAAAQRVSAGHLGERMQVQGVDDLAALATSFNDMAASLQGKLRELEDLSNVQRQFVSDVSHELRTPLSTIKMAADLLFEARAELDAAAGRSVELLQSQLDRFESLLVDLLEISRFDARAA